MARIRIDDLPQDIQISREEMKKVMGGITALYPNLTQPMNSTNLNFNDQFKAIDTSIFRVADGMDLYSDCNCADCNAINMRG